MAPPETAGAADKPPASSGTPNLVDAYLSGTAGGIFLINQMNYQLGAIYRILLKEVYIYIQIVYIYILYVYTQNSIRAINPFKGHLVLKLPGPFNVFPV